MQLLVLRLLCSTWDSLLPFISTSLSSLEALWLSPSHP